MTSIENKRKPADASSSKNTPRKRPPAVSTWNSTMLPLSTVQRKTNRVHGRMLAVLGVFGIIIGLLLSFSLFIVNLVGMIRPLQDPGDPTYSLAALAALCDLDDPASSTIPTSTMNIWAPNISGAEATLEIAQEQYRAVQSIEPRSDPRVHNILLISKPLDNRSGPVNNEVLLLLSINRRTDNARLVSFDRTMLANIPDKGWSLLGHAACMGGVDLVRSTMADNYRLKIDDALMFNIADISKAVDMLGGINIRLTENEVVYLRKNQPQISATVGLNRMNGETALVYSQISGVGDQNEHNRRLLRIFEAIQAKSANLSVLQLKDLAQALLPGLQSDLSTVDRYKVLYDVFMSRRYPLTTWAYSMDDPAESYLRTIITRQKRDAGAAYRVMTLHEFLFGLDS